MKTTLFKKILFVSAILLAINTQSQIEQPEVKFYVNNGATEVKAIECYDFDNLMVKFKATPLLFGSYETVDFMLLKKTKDSEVKYYKTFNSDVIKSAFQGKKEVTDWVFSSSDTKALSDYTALGYTDKLGRIELQYTIEKANVEGTTLEFYVIGNTITGYKEELNGNTITKRPIYSETEITKTGILHIKNRVFVDNEAAKKSNKLKGFIPVAKVLVKDKEMKVPEDVVKTGTCFPANGKIEATPETTGNTTIPNNSSISNTTPSNTNSSTPKTTSTSSNNNSPAVKDGPVEEKHSNGGLKTTGTMKNGLQVGTWKYYNSKGEITMEENYNSKGELEGKTTQYIKGTPQFETNYKAGKKEGRYAKYKPDGKLLEEGNYKNGLKDGEWKTYNPDGTVKETKKFKEGAPQI